MTTKIEVLIKKYIEYQNEVIKIIDCSILPSLDDFDILDILLYFIYFLILDNLTTKKQFMILLK